MKRIIPLLGCVLLGIGVGWYAGYTRPTAKHQREILKQYQYVRDNFDMTDAEMAEAGANLPKYLEGIEREDELAAVFALGAFRMLERGDTERAKAHLLKAVGSYYRVYHDTGGDTNLMANIEEAAQKYPAVAAELSRKVE